MLDDELKAKADPDSCSDDFGCKHSCTYVGSFWPVDFEFLLFGGKNSKQLGQIY